MSADSSPTRIPQPSPKARRTPRYLAVWLPHLPTDRLRRSRGGTFCGLPDDLPLIVYERIRSADVLVAVDAAALRLGLQPGLALADARARLGHRLYAAPAAPSADATLLDGIAADCDRYTPLVGRDPPDGVILDITGAAHLMGGEALLAAAVTGRLAAAGLVARTAIAGAPDTARALARYGRAHTPCRGTDETAGLPPRLVAPQLVVSVDGDSAAVEPLPVAALRLPQETVTGLVRAGLKTIGCVARRPRAPLAARFGPLLIDRLERTLGQVVSPISPWRPQPVVHADLVCGEPIVRGEDVDSALSHLATELAMALEPREEGARRIEAAFFRVDGHIRRIEVALARPSREPRAIARLFAERLAALTSPLDPGFGFERIRLAALHAEPLPVTQTALGHGPTPDDRLTKLIDRLSARFGAANVTRWQTRDSHIPERASALVAATSHEAAREAPAKLGTPPAWPDTPSAWPHTPSAWPTPAPDEPPARPATLFEPPQPIEAMAPVPDGPPLRFRWRRVVHDVVLAEGPERVAPEWWRLPPATAPHTSDATRTDAGSAPQPRIRGKALPREGIPRRKQTAVDATPRPTIAARADANGEAPAAQSCDWLTQTRDYYRVEDRHGRRYWLFRAGLWVPGSEPPRWFMHGLFA